jgi:hypothetical protein
MNWYKRTERLLRGRGGGGAIYNFISLFPSICSEDEEQIIIFLHKEMTEKGRGERLQF